MHSKLILIDGTVIEIEGTPQEVDDLVVSLRRSGSIAAPPKAAPEAAAEAPRTGSGPDRDDSSPVKPSPKPIPHQASTAFQMLSDPTRLRILRLLAERDLNVGELVDSLGNTTQPAVSSHLELLRNTSLVRALRRGKFQIHGLTNQGRVLIETVGRLIREDHQRAGEMFRQASDPTRLRILALLSEGDRNVGELCAGLGARSQPAVSHHLAKMRHGGVVEVWREGKTNRYSLRDEGRELARLAALLAAAGGMSDERADPEKGEREDEALDLAELPGNGSENGAAFSRDDAAEGPSADDDASRTHDFCRRILLMVRELHRLGFERLRVDPAPSPSGMHWRCSIYPTCDIRQGRPAGEMTDDAEEAAVHYSSAEGTTFAGWTDAAGDSPAELARKFLDRLGELARAGQGSDPDYARWYDDMLIRTEPDGVIFAESSYGDLSVHSPSGAANGQVAPPPPPPPPS